MALDSLTARANTGAGTDALAGKATASGFAGAAILLDADGNQITNDNGLPVNSSNVGNKFREAFEAYDPVSGGKWTQTLANGDIIAVDGNTASSSYLVISKDPLTANGESRISTVATWGMPFEAAIGLSMSQRTVGQEFSLEVVSDETPLSEPADLQISAIQQATTTLTVTTATAHGLKPGMRVGIRDCSDSRMNYPALVVATTPSATQFTATAGPGGTIPSVTAGPFASGYVDFRSTMGLAPNGTSLIFENSTVTNASIYVRSESGDVLPSGTIAGNHSVTIATTASVQAINAATAYAFQPTNEFRLTQFIDGLQWSDAPIDSINAATNRLKRTQVVPDINHNYRLRIRAVNNPSLTRPVAHILSVAKTGTTTATVVTQTAHGLTTGDVIAAYGVRDQTNFANLTTATAVASVVDATTFTVVWGAAVTASSQAGVIYRVNGGVLPSSLGAIAQVVQSATRTSNIVTLVGNAAWSGLLIGDYVNIAALHDTGGTDLALDGPYRVRDIQTTSLFLEPIGNAPTGTDIVTTNCGGAVIKRTDMRISYARIMDFDRQRVELISRPTGDVSASAPVSVQNTVTVDTELPAAAAVADGLTNPTAPQIAADALLFNGTTWDRARGNLNTTTGDTGAKTATYAGATQTNYNARGAYITIFMGTVTGTTPSYTPQLQWSPDGGTTWLNFGPAMTAITATGNHTLLVYPSNMSQAAGGTPANLTTGAASTTVVNAALPRTWRLNNTISGTTPSFTLTSVQVNYIL